MSVVFYVFMDGIETLLRLGLSEHKHLPTWYKAVQKDETVISPQIRRQIQDNGGLLLNRISL